MKRIKYLALTASLSLIFSFGLYADQYPHKLTVLIKGATANTGQAIASLFTSAENYLKAPVSKQVMPINDAGEAHFTFSDLDVGKYAVSIVYDENSDGKLNTGFLGIPTELVGFSNNAKATFGPPSFQKASFTIPESKTISIILVQAKE